MREGRRQLLAWGVLVGAFALCVVLTLGVPLLLDRWVRSATSPAPALVERRAGSVTVERNGVTVLLSPADREEVTAGEGAIVTTHGDGVAFVRLFDDATVHIEPNTRVVLESLRRPRFGRGRGPAAVRLRAEDLGETPARVTVASTYAPTALDVATRDGAVHLAPESRVRLSIDDSASTAYAMAGAVDVTSSGTTIHMAPDTVTDVRTGHPPTRPRPALDEVLANGSFERPPAAGWLVRSDGEPPGRASTELTDGRWALTMERRGASGRPGDIVLEQGLGSRATGDAVYLGVTTTMRIDSQSLLAGGERDTEYPLILTLVLERADGTEDVPWELGFYAVDPTDPDPPAPGRLGFTAIPVPRGRWVTFSSGNLLDPTSGATLEGLDGMAWEEQGRAALAAIERLQDPPKRLLRFEVKSSGHDWSTHLDRVGLWVK